MKTYGTLIMTISVLGFLFSPEAFAEPQRGWTGGGGWGQGSSYGRLYDPATVGTVSGKVIGVEKITPMKGMSYGVHLVLKTDEETLSIHLGPNWFIENQDIQINPGDKIEVRGSRITYEGKPAIIAATVSKDDQVLLLRDENGFPVWSGWRRR